GRSSSSAAERLAPKRLPHFIQCRAWAGLEVPHAGHCMEILPTTGCLEDAFHVARSRTKVKRPATGNDQRNDECQMTNDERMTNDECPMPKRNADFLMFRHLSFGHWSLFRHSCFDIRH